MVVRLFIKEEYMSIQNRMLVKDEEGKDTYLIVGKWGRAGDSLSIYTMGGDRLVEAKQQKLSIFPKFDLLIDGEKICSVKKHPGLFGIKNPYFTVSKFQWLITGDFIAQQYTVRKKSKVIMKLEKSCSFMGNLFSLTISNDEVAPLCCILAVIVDHYSPSKESVFEEFKQKQYSLGFLHPILLELSRKSIHSKE